MKKLYIFITSLILCFNAQSQITQLNDSSMHGGKINGYAKNSNCLLVATDGGIFKTTNQGLNWTNASQNFDPTSVKCRSIFTTGSDFYAMADNSSNQGIYKSTDNGINWTPLSPTTWWIQTMGTIGSTLFVIGGDNNGGRLYKSADGINWTPGAMVWYNNSPSGNTQLLTFNQNKIYVNTNDSLFFTTDGNALTAVEYSGLNSTSFNHDNNFGGDVLGNLYYQGDGKMFKYNFTTKTWSDISTGKIPNGFGIMEFSVTDNAIFIIAYDNVSSMRMYRSTNQGTSFTELTNIGLMFPLVSNIIEASATGFIGNTIDDRTVISSNGGSTWSITTSQYIATPANNLILSGNSLLFTREIKGVVRSTNQGNSWAASNTGIPGFSGIAFFVEDIIQVKDTVFTLVRADPFTDDLVLFKSSNNGASWAQFAIPAPFNAGYEYSFSGKCDSALFVNYFDPISSNYALIVSYNNGASWANANSQNNNNQTFLTGTKNCLFAFRSPSNTWEDFDNVSKANNFGASFTDLNTGGLFSNNFMIKRVMNGRGDKSNAMMDFDASNNKAIFVIRDRNMGNGEDKLYLHNMLTNTWSQITTVGLPANYIAGSIKFKGSNGWLLATNTGLYKSSNGGINWTPAHTAAGWQKGIVVNTIQVIANNVFLGTESNGIWMVDLGVGILNKISEDNTTLYPNPTAGLLNIEVPEFSGNAQVTVYSIDGKVIRNTIVGTNHFEVNLNDQPAGSYVIVISTNNAVYRKVFMHN